MTARQLLRQCLDERRNYQRGSLEWLYRTAAARKLYWMHIGKPTTEWSKT